jgi:hypothetical protein
VGTGLGSPINATTGVISAPLVGHSAAEPGPVGSELPPAQSKDDPDQSSFVWLPRHNATTQPCKLPTNLSDPNCGRVTFFYECRAETLAGFSLEIFASTFEDRLFLQSGAMSIQVNVSQTLSTSNASSGGPAGVWYWLDLPDASVMATAVNGTGCR